MNFGKLSWRHPLVMAGAAVVVLIGAYLLWGPDSGSSPRGRKGGRDMGPAPVLVAEAKNKDMPVYLDGLGTVQAYNTVTIRSRIDGELIHVGFREGQEVKAGDVLAKIDSRVYDAQLAQAQAAKAKDEAQLENARHDLERYASLGNRVTAQTADTQRALVKQLEAAVKADQAAIDNARTMQSYATIVSPIDGRTGIRQIDPGNIVRVGDASGLVVVTQLQPISVIFSLPQQELPAINARLRQPELVPVLVTGSDGRTVIERGQLDLVDNQIDATTGTVRLKASFPNEQRLLWPGGFVNVRLWLTSLTGALTVPAAAIQRGPQGAYVFVLRDDNTVALRPVKPGRSQDGDTVIEDGLTAGEKVVIEGMARLQDGSAVVLARDGARPGGGKAGEGKAGEGKAGEGKTGENGPRKEGGKKKRPDGQGAPP